MLATPRWHETGGQHPNSTEPHDPDDTGQSHRIRGVQAEARTCRATVAKVALDAALDTADAALVRATHADEA